MAATHVALLRGINVTGKHLLPMKDLKILFEACGAKDVSTYIQSGNVLYAAAPRTALTLAKKVRNRIEADFGFSPSIVVRTIRELSELSARNPFLKREPNFSHLLVFFLENEAKCTNLGLERFAPDEFILSGQECFAYFPKGIGQSKFQNAHLDKAVGCATTARNWNTVLKLLDLART